MIAASVPAAEATVWTMLFSRIEEDSEPAQHRHRDDRGRDRGGEGEADLEAEIDVGGGEDQGDEPAEDHRPQRQLPRRLRFFAHAATFLDRRPPLSGRTGAASRSVGRGPAELDAEIGGRRVAAADQQQHRVAPRRARRGDGRRRLLRRAGGALVDRQDDVAAAGCPSRRRRCSDRPRRRRRRAASASLSCSDRAISGVSAWTVRPRPSRVERWPTDCCDCSGSLTGFCVVDAVQPRPAPPRSAARRP